MKTVFVLFDSLNRHVLAPYGGCRVPTPNFDRLARRAVTFDRHYAGSLPCMPARRDLHTGRLSFLHRSWGPLEPFDDSVPELLHEAGVYSHLITDHQHYFEDGGANYHTRFNSFEFIRGQEGDPWRAMVHPPWDRLREMYHAAQFATDRKNYKCRNMINRLFQKDEEDFPSAQVFAGGIEFLDRNRDADDWFLQIETFDPHEPFQAPGRFKAAFETGWNGPIRDWPRYGRVDELPEECAELRANYFALVAFCDHLLGRLLDCFDHHDLWRDTALIVTTDHGFLLGEHDIWAKNRMNLYQEVVHLPLFIHQPHRGRAGTRRGGLTQTMDLAATFLDLHAVAARDAMQAQSLLPLLDQDRAFRDGVLYGYFGGAINVTDGRFTYHRFPGDMRQQELFEYTLMPSHHWKPFSVDELRQAVLTPPQGFAKGLPVLRVPVPESSTIYANVPIDHVVEGGTRIFDLDVDPGQDRPLRDPDREALMRMLMQELMERTEAPREAFERVGLG